MTRASDDGARLVLFTEGALSGYPDKRKMSRYPDRLAESDWSRLDWAALADELAATVEHAGKVGLWAVVGSVHRDAGSARPFNSLYVIGETGRLVGRYDKRYLSPSESTYMFAAGDHPTGFEVDGFRFGCAVCVEACLPEVFAEYESQGADCVLLAGGDRRLAKAHALLTGMWVAFAAYGDDARSGVASPDGRWLAKGRPGGTPRVLFADLDPQAMRPGYDYGYRPWRAFQRDGHSPTPAEITAARGRSGQFVKR